MNGYRRAWLIACRTIAALGACLTIIVYPLTTTIGLLCAGAAVGAVVSYSSHHAGGVGPPRLAQFHRVGINAMSAGISVMAIAGFAVVLGAWLWLLVLAVAAMSPWAMHFLLRNTTPHVPPASTATETERLPDVPVEAGVFAPPIRVLDDLELCRAWSRSYRWLEEAHSVALHAYVVTLRQAYLDELDRRDPVGFQAWLDSCPRSRGGPVKFLHHGTDDHRMSA